MFSFLFSGEVTDDAIKLVNYMDQLIIDAEKLNKEDFVKRYIDDKYSSNNQEKFAFLNKLIPDFAFHYSNRDNIIDIFVSGRTKYRGFSMVTSGIKRNYSNWCCSSSDRILYKATKGSKKLTKIISKKFGVRIIVHDEY